jgi:multidrug resistance efflux pump
MDNLLRLKSALRSGAPVLTLLSTLGLAAWLHSGGGGQRGHIVGFAEGTPEAIGPTELARVISVNVEVGDEIKPGQVVATLDTADIDAELAVAEAKKVKLEAEVRTDQTLLERRLDVDLESLQREMARAREEQSQASAEAKALDGEMSRVKRLIEDRQAVFEELSQLGLRHASVKAIADEKPRTLGLLAAQVKAAEQRKERLKASMSTTTAELEAELLVAQRNIERLQQRRAGYVLRSTHAGRVAAIGKQPGEVAAAGDPVVRIVSARERVVACIPERSALSIHEGDTARLWVRGQSGDAIPGKTVALGPIITELPTRCWPTPSLPLWGREVTIALDVPVQVVAGQAFDVAFEPTHGAPAATPSPSPPQQPQQPVPGDVATGPLPMTVPRALVQRSRFEPSGILRRPGESRYLIISDDTGRDGDEGEPWLFAMSASGAVDPDPVPVSGISTLDDVEAITAGDGGEIYLLSSQSFSRKGKRKPARTALLRLRPEGHGLRVDGEVHLAELLDADPARATALGLPEGTRALDIEGLAFQGGALYFGLKAPLDAQGNAMIWRAASPSALFDARPTATARVADDKGPGRLADAGLSLWARARVDVELDGKPTPGGISDLLFLPDGSLAMTSTPSTADGAAGAIWQVEHPASGALTPRLVRRFPGLKPEGISPSLSPGKLMIVFDAGSETPSFQELPWLP